MFGSDQMVWPDVISVGVASVNNAEFLTLDQKEDIFYDNAARFLGLSDGEDCATQEYEMKGAVIHKNH